MASASQTRILAQSSLVPIKVAPSVIDHIDGLLNKAVESGASDVHIDPSPGTIRIRFRVDGFLKETVTFPSALHSELIARLKILACLRTDEHQRPQDGRFRFVSGEGVEIDIRISVMPTHHGENAVLRILVQDLDRFTLTALGCSRSHRTLLEKAIAKPHGLILATGPTGSGKTTLLYSLIRMIDAETRSIITIEDPIEYSLPGVTQIPADPAHGLSFANGLRSILRQDPDIVMIGEMRDTETARLATNAALTGHLVFSTLHTNDAASAVPRLLDLGIEPYLTASTLSLIVAQRLVRRLCDTCRIEHSPDQAERERIRNWAGTRYPVPESLFRGRGCAECQGTGYRGRIGIFEMLAIDETLSGALSLAKDAELLRSLARERGMLPMSADGMMKAAKGLTTLDELMRVTYA